MHLDKMAEKWTLSEKNNVNGEKNERLGYCILSTVKDHHCNFCKMIAEGSNRKKGTKRVDRLYVKKLRNNAIIPCRGTHGAAGYDLSSVEDLIISGKGKGVVKTGLAIATPEDTYARIAPRSGLAVKQFIDVGAGVVDADYRGEVGVVLFNHADDGFRISQGDRIAQMILERIKHLQRRLSMSWMTPQEEQLVLEVLGYSQFQETILEMIVVGISGNNQRMKNLPSQSLKAQSESIL